MPFSREQFFEVFAAYNVASWPLPIVLVAVTLGCVAAAWLDRSDRAIGWWLAILWAWSGIVYQLVFFARINPAAWVFGALFLAGAAVFAQHALAGTLRFAKPTRASAAGVALVAYALIGYPIVNVVTGHVYPRTPVFGVPCPITIFTLGILLTARPPVPAAVFVVPLLWAVIGSSAAFLLDVQADVGLAVAAAVVVVQKVFRNGMIIGTRRLY